MESFTNIYKFNTVIGGIYRHEWKNIAVTEIFLFNGILVRDVIIDGRNCALYEQWNPNSPIYSPEFSQYMALPNFCEIKRNIKL